MNTASIEIIDNENREIPNKLNLAKNLNERTEHKDAKDKVEKKDHN